MIKNKELGRLLVQTGDIVCFSMDAIVRLAEKLGVSEDTLIKEHEGVSCGFKFDGNYGVDSMTAVNKDGSTHSVVVIGSKPDEFLRFLGEDEQGFQEFYRGHARYSEIGSGANFNQAIFKEISTEYRQRLLT